jgi:hypothetical protein
MDCDELDTMDCDWLVLYGEMGCDWVGVWSCFCLLLISMSAALSSTPGVYPPVVDSFAEVHLCDSVKKKVS